jgi:hypothetical protein
LREPELLPAILVKVDKSKKEEWIIFDFKLKNESWLKNVVFLSNISNTWPFIVYDYNILLITKDKWFV